MCGKPACPARYSHNLLVSGHLVTWRRWPVVSAEGQTWVGQGVFSEWRS